MRGQAPGSWPQCCFLHCPSRHALVLCPALSLPPKLPLPCMALAILGRTSCPWILPESMAMPSLQSPGAGAGSGQAHHACPHCSPLCYHLSLHVAATHSHPSAAPPITWGSLRGTSLGPHHQDGLGRQHRPSEGAEEQGERKPLAR